MKLVAHWRLWWRRQTTWLAGINALLWAIVTDHSGQLLGFIPWLPERWHIPSVIAVFILSWVIPVLFNHLRQPKLQQECEEIAIRAANP